MSPSIKYRLCYCSGLNRLFPFPISWDPHFWNPTAILWGNQSATWWRLCKILGHSPSWGSCQQLTSTSKHAVSELFIRDQHIYLFFSVKGQLVIIYIVGHPISATDTQKSHYGAKVTQNNIQTHEQNWVPIKLDLQK